MRTETLARQHRVMPALIVLCMVATPPLVLDAALVVTPTDQWGDQSFLIPELLGRAAPSLAGVAGWLTLLLDVLPGALTLLLLLQVAERCLDTEREAAGDAAGSDRRWAPWIGLVGLLALAVRIWLPSSGPLDYDYACLVYPFCAAAAWVLAWRLGVRPLSVNLATALLITIWLVGCIVPSMRSGRFASNTLFVSLLGWSIAWLFVVLIPIALWERRGFDERDSFLRRYLVLLWQFALDHTVNATVLGFAVLGFCVLVPLTEGFALQPYHKVTLVVLVMQQSVSAYVALVTRGAVLGIAATHREIEQAVERMRDHYVLAGFDRLGQHTAKEIIAHTRNRPRWERTRLLPVVSDEWVKWHDANSGLKAGAMPFYSRLLVVDQDPSKFLHTFESERGVSLGLALIRVGGRHAVQSPEGGSASSRGRPGAPQWGVAPAVVGRLASQGVEEISRLFSARVVVSTIADRDETRALIRHYRERAGSSTQAPNLPTMVVVHEKESERIFAQEMVLKSRCTSVVPGHVVASAFAHKLHFYAAGMGMGRDTLLITDPADFDRLLLVYWALVERTGAAGAAESLQDSLRLCTTLGDWGEEVSDAEDALFKHQVSVYRRARKLSGNDHLQLKLAQVPDFAGHQFTRLIKGYCPSVIAVFLPRASSRARDILMNTIGALRKLLAEEQLTRNGRVVKPRLLVTCSYPDKFDAARALDEYDQIERPATYHFGYPEGLVDTDAEVWQVIGGVLNAIDRGPE